MKSDEMAKSWVAQMASQTMGMILSSRAELEEKKSEYLDDLNWLRMRIEDLEEVNLTLSSEVQEEKTERGKITEQLARALKERDQFRTWWFENNKQISNLERELDSIKKSDAATSDQEVIFK